MCRRFLFLGILILLLSGFVASAPSSTSPAKIVNSFISNHGISLLKWLWSFKTTTKTAVPTKSMVKFENGYSVETVLDGSKLGIEPYSLQVLPNGELLILDSQNSNIYKIASSSLSLYSRPRLVTGSPEGYPGHVDGRLRDARLNNPKGITVDDRGNIYVADTVNNAIRKISEAGVTTIAGGKMVRGGGHVDGPSEDAKFSNDFDVVYLGSSCSLLVIDRGNQAIREIQLHFDDCADQYGSGFPLVLVAAGFFGYMLALLQRRLSSIVSYHTDQELFEAAPDQGTIKPVRPPLIPSGDEEENQEESFIGTLRIFILNAWVFTAELFTGMFPSLRKKQTVTFNFNHQETKNSAFSTTSWPVQESFVIQNKDEPPPIESRNPTPRKIYPFMSKDATEKMQQLRQSRALYRSLDAEFLQEQQQQKHRQHHHRHHSTIPHTLYERSNEKTNEIVFGPGQEQDHRRVAAAATAKSTESGEQMNTHQNIHYRAHQFVSYPYGYYS
ncbi:uncharacterized protein LOC17899794 isoform X2 [Capsella rubella]|uniref:uncharacterized protein LOC17899794 isoform X2 n=1 Tax=Capsella rubella TaxID=81985 RepID=UPI000CD589AD|nr:uncharacterized protein LOC17899794 isoform X2 [Capsella rubella]